MNKRHEEITCRFVLGTNEAAYFLHGSTGEQRRETRTIIRVYIILGILPASEDFPARRKLKTNPERSHRAVEEIAERWKPVRVITYLVPYQ